jgi:outer membrane protein assembly factor BamB
MTGAVLWTRSLPRGELNDRPAVDNHGTVYVIFGSAEKTHYSSSSSPSSSSSYADVAAAAAGDGDNVPPALTFHAVDAETGAVRWSNNVSGAYSSPVAAGGVVYVATGEGALAAVNASNGHLKWSVPGVTNTWAGPAVDGGLAFGVTESGTLTAVDASTGESRWQRSFEGYNPLTPVAAGSKVYVAGALDTLYAFDAATGATAWNASHLCSNHLWSVPAVADGAVYVGSDADSTLHVMNAVTGAPMWNFSAVDAVRSPVVANGTVFFGTNSVMSPGSPEQMYALLAP